MSDTKSYSSLAGPVLVPVDLTNGSKSALVSGAEIAELSGVPLIVLHVVHDLAENPGFYKRRSESDAAWPIRDLAERMVDELVAECRAEHPEIVALAKAETLIVEGLPYGRIVEVAAQREVGLIVVASHVKSSLNRLLTGSVSESIVRHAPCAVTVLRGGQSASPARVEPDLKLVKSASVARGRAVAA